MKPVIVHIPPNATYQNRYVAYRPVRKNVLTDSPVGTARGVLVIIEERVKGGKEIVSPYLLVEMPHHNGGRSFYFIKREGEKYGVQVYPRPLCECTGFAQYGHCKHLECLKALLDGEHLSTV